MLENNLSYILFFIVELELWMSWNWINLDLKRARIRISWMDEKIMKFEQDHLLSSVKMENSIEKKNKLCKICERMVSRGLCSIIESIKLQKLLRIRLYADDSKKLARIRLKFKQRDEFILDSITTFSERRCWRTRKKLKKKKILFVSWRSP